MTTALKHTQTDQRTLVQKHTHFADMILISLRLTSRSISIQLRMQLDAHF